MSPSPSTISRLLGFPLSSAHGAVGQYNGGPQVFACRDNGRRNLSLLYVQLGRGLLACVLCLLQLRFILVPCTTSAEQFYRTFCSVVDDVVAIFESAQIRTTPMCCFGHFFWL